jgi:hypothetical protein
MPTNLLVFAVDCAAAALLYARFGCGVFRCSPIVSGITVFARSLAKREL